MNPPIRVRPGSTLARTFALCFASPVFAALAAAGPVRESARELPVAAEVDVVVVGGTTWGVAAALGAAEKGATVFLAAERPYLGEDLCGTLRLSLEDGETSRDPLARAIFGGERSATPLQAKKALDDALVQAGVGFLFGCYPAGVLRDSEGVPAGVLIANRAGRQAVIAKVMIDATPRASVSRQAGARCAPWPAGDHAFSRIVISGADAASSAAVEHDLRLPMPDASFRSFAAAEQAARAATWRDDVLRGAESLHSIPPDPITGETPHTRWKAAKPDLGHFRPAGVPRVYVIGGAADMPRDEADRLLRPAAMIPLGRRMGWAAARDAKSLPAPGDVHLPGDGAGVAAPAVDTRENLNGLRPSVRADRFVAAAARPLPTLAEVDVLVIGGGTAGACVAIGAARRGARTLVVEYQEGLGGIGTLGMIGKPHRGLNIGFTREVPFPSGSIEVKMEWYRSEIAKAGGEIWLGALGCGAVVDGDRVVGAVVATPQGRGAVLARVVIDATGNSDIAAAAGATILYGDEAGDIAMQGTGLPARPLDRSYVNSDYLLVDESDMLDVWSAFVGTRQAMGGGSFDAGTLIQTRERRRIAGEHVLRYVDQIIGRTYPDTICHSSSNYDSHGYPSNPFFALLPHDGKSLRANHPAPGGACFTPYRCLLPKGLDGILVVGLGISMERDASAMVRMQRDLQNQGYAAGVAAAVLAETGGPTRDLDVRALQAHLVEIGNLPPEVLDHADNLPMGREALRAAVSALANSDREKAAVALAVVLAHGDAMMLPDLRAAHAAAAGDVRLVYARILGFMGQGDVAPELIEALGKITAWDDKILQGVGAEYAHLPTPVDALILALGHAGDRGAMPLILTWLERLDAQTTLSHHRAVAVALERLADPSAAEPLARLLGRPGMRGHAMTELETLSSDRDHRRREGALREIVLARALVRCGDHDGMGRGILEAYRSDIRGLFAGHAAQILGGESQTPNK